MSRGMVLLVDDEQEIVEQCSRALRSEGYEVDTASNGKEGWERYQARYYDVVIADWKMQEMDGLELLQNIDRMHPFAKVIIITAFGDEEFKRMVISAHAFGYLEKPIYIDELLSKVEEAIQLKGSVMAALGDWAKTHPEEVSHPVRSRLEETQRQEAELLRARQMATLGVMAFGMAHEINQPLQVILSVAQNCIKEIQQNAIDNEGILADLEKVAVNTKRIDRIVNHLLMLARDREPKLEDVDVNTVIENSFIMFHQQLTKARGIKILRNLSPDLSPVRADTVQLEQVLINLISNSRDALEGCKNKIIEVSTEEQDEHILVRFQDNGRGIASEDLPKIFDAFFTTKEKGMGLGLHIARDTIQSYGGTITAQSEINKGTTFMIRLPVAKKEDTE